LTEPATPLLDWLLAALLLAGSLSALIGSIGLAKLGDFYRRVHGPAKTATLGVGALLIASSLFFTRLEGHASLRELLVLAFLFVTAPVSAQLLVKAALARDASAPPPPAAPTGPPAPAMRATDEIPNTSAHSK
jgi:multicomponent K+:H+ antiporter subunit G